MIIDSHIHVFSRYVASKKSKFLKDRGFCLLYRSPESKIVTVEEARLYAQKNGIDRLWAMGFSWEASRICDMENENIMSDMDNDSLFVPFFSVSSTEDRFVKTRIRKAAENRFKGVGEIAFYQRGLDKTKDKYLRLIFEAAQEEQLPVCLHVTEPIGHQYCGKHPTDLTEIYALIEDFPGLKIILAHMGGGIFVYELMPEVKKAFTNVYYDTAAVPYLYSPEIYRHAKEIIGKEKILFGSDYPLLSIDRYGKMLQTYLSADDAEFVLGKNAEMLIGVGKARI